MTLSPTTTSNGHARLDGFLREWLLPSRDLDRHWWGPAIGLAYIGAIAALGGLRVDHLLGLLGFLDIYNRRTRSFLRTFLPFILTGVVFDSMRYFYWPAIEGRVHVRGPYELERALFGVGGYTLNEVFALRHWVVADVLAGVAYLTFVAEYLGLAMLLWFRGFTARAHTFARAFFVVNVMGFITYIAYPAAPPWYVSAHGLGPATQWVPPSPAAAVRFDELFGTHVFEAAYSKAIDMFGAIPSLHVAYPTMAALLALEIPQLRWARLPTLAFALLMAFSAVYLQHHYLIDVVLGVGYGVVALAIVRWWERRCSLR